MAIGTFYIPLFTRHAVSLEGSRVQMRFEIIENFTHRLYCQTWIFEIDIWCMRDCLEFVSIEPVVEMQILLCVVSRSVVLLRRVRQPEQHKSHLTSAFPCLGKHLRISTSFILDEIL